MTQKYIHKHARTVVTEICYALVQASYGDIHHGEKMVLYRSEGGDNWLRSTGEFIDKFVYMHQVGAPSYWKHKKTGGKYTVVHDPVVCASNIMGEMDMVIVYEFEDGRRCAMETHHFAGMFEVFTPAKSEPIEGQIRETEDKKEVFWGGKWMTYWEKPKHTMCFKASREQWATQTAASIKRAVNRADGHPYEYVKTVEIPVPKWVKDAPTFKATQKQMATQVAAEAKKAVNRAGGPFKYVKTVEIPMAWTPIKTATQEEATLGTAKTDDIYKEVADRLNEDFKAQHAHTFIQYYKDGITHVAFVKRLGHKGVPIRGDNLGEVMQAAAALLWARV